MGTRLTEKLHFRCTNELYLKVLAEAEKEGCDKSEITRRIVEEHYRNRELATVSKQLEESLRKVLDPFIDRLTALIAHSGVAAGTSAWMAKALFKQLIPSIDSDAVFVQAESRAKENVRRLRLSAEVDE